MTGCVLSLNSALPDWQAQFHFHAQPAIMVSNLSVVLLAILASFAQAAPALDATDPPIQDIRFFNFTEDDLSAFRSAETIISNPTQEYKGPSLNDVLYYNDIDDGRSANEKPDSRWPGGIIPLYLDSHFNPQEVQAIRHGLYLIMSTTCLKFSYSDRTERNIIFVKRGEPESGCYTQYVGRSRYPVARLNLEPNDHCMRPGVVAHELLHVAGLYHQMTRPDRDEYIEILWNNMEDDKETRYQYEIQAKSLTYGVPYDYGSLMHYPDTAGSKNSEPVMVKKKESDAVMGQRDRLSENDAAIIRAMYCQ